MVPFTYKLISPELDVARKISTLDIEYFLPFPIYLCASVSTPTRPQVSQSASRQVSIDFPDVLLEVSWTPFRCVSRRILEVK